jgi:tetratricopeptide (TPR) repeat protein
MMKAVPLHRVFILSIGTVLLLLSPSLAQSKSKGSAEFQNVYNLVERANDLYQRGAFSKAIIMYRKAERRGADPVITAFNTGNCYFRQDQMPQAAAAFRKADRASGGEYLPAVFNLAAVLFRLGEYSNSISVYHRALSKEPANEGAWIYLAEAYSRTGDYIGTLRALEKARILNPDDISIVYQMAETHVNLKEYDAAIELVRVAYGQKPEETDFLIYEGDLHRLNKDFQSAAASFREALSLQPTNTDLMYKLADALVADQKPFLAMDYLQTAIGLKPDFTDASVFLGNLVFDAKWWDRALSAYADAASKGNKEGIQGIRNIAYELESMGDIEAAIEYLEEASKLDPDDITLKMEIANYRERLTQRD